MKRIAIMAILIGFVCFASICCGITKNIGMVNIVNEVPGGVEEVCLDSFYLYEDKEFKKPLPEDSIIMKKMNEKRDKYIKRVGRGITDALAREGLTFVECPSHIRKGSDVTTIDDANRPFHLKILLGYEGTPIKITIYSKIEIYHEEKLICTLPLEVSATMEVLLDRKRRKEELYKIGDEVAAKLAKKIKESQAEKKQSVEKD